MPWNVRNRSTTACVHEAPSLQKPLTYPEITLIIVIIVVSSALTLTGLPVVGVIDLVCACGVLGLRLVYLARNPTAAALQ
jgi:hypothetical protein